MTDGCNGHTLALGSDPEIAVESPAPNRAARCLARITREGKTGWCLLPTDHDPAVQHEGVLSTPPMSDGFGPRSKR